MDETDTFCDEGELFRDGHNASDVIQGKLGDCWFLGGLAVLANEKSYLENIFFTQLSNVDDLEEDQSRISMTPLNISQRWLDSGVWVCRFNKV